MRAEEMWRQSGLPGSYRAWAFGGAPDELAQLVYAGRKTATSSAFALYAHEDEPLPRLGEHSVVLDSRGDAVCVIRTTRVYVTPFRHVTAGHARREGEGDRSLGFWRRAHRAFFEREMSAIHRVFDEDMEVVCEEFTRVFPRPDPPVAADAEEVKEGAP